MTAVHDHEGSHIIGARKLGGEEKMLVIVPDLPTRMVTKSLSCLGPLCLALVAAFLLLVASASAEVTGPVAEPGSAASTEATPVPQGTEQGGETGVGVPVAGTAPGT